MNPSIVAKLKPVVKPREILQRFNYFTGKNEGFPVCLEKEYEDQVVDLTVREFESLKGSDAANLNGTIAFVRSSWCEGDRAGATFGFSDFV